MNKRLLIGILAGGILIGSAIAVTAAKNDTKPQEDEYKMEMLTIEEVRDLIQTKYRGKIEEIELKHNNNQAYYEIELESDDQEMELVIDAYSGKLLFYEEKEMIASAPVQRGDLDDRGDDGDFDKAELKDAQKPGTKTADAGKDEPKNKTKAKNNQPAAFISSAEAVRIAEAKTGAKVAEVEKDEDDGRIIYEIELVKNGKEIEMEIDAKTGKILEIEYDDDDDWDDD